MKNEFIKSLFAIMLCSATSIAQIPLNGLAAYYPFNGNALDSSGNGHNGTVNGAVLTTDRFGNSNHAYLFDGISADVAVPNFNSILSSDEVSLSFWAISYQLKSQSAFLLIPDNPNDRFNIHINYDHNGTSTTFWDYGNIFSNGRIAIDPDPYVIKWNHYVFISSTSQNQMAIYRNDTLKLFAQQSSPLIDKNKTLNIGGGIGSGSTNLFFNGAIDDVAIYNRVLTATEIHQIYTASGCTGMTASIAAYGNTSFCSGSNVLLVATPGFSGYQWQKNAANISGATGSSYTANATGSYRCITTCGTSTATSNAIALTKLNNASVTISASGSTTFCAGTSATLNGTNPGAGYTYQWYRNNVSINGANGLSYVAYNPGAYKMVTTNSVNGCSRISNAINIVVNCRIANPEIPSGSIERDNNLIVYPNPTSGSFTIELNDEENTEGVATIELLNTVGQKLFQSTEQIEKGQLEKEINFGGNDVKNGLYILKVIINDKVYESKVMIN